ncbi:MAG: hypothetical protein V3T83_05820, partial [Acidobacteriota bacterium]
RQARLEIECDTGAGSSNVRESLSLRQGTSPIDVSQKSFPVLYELMAKDAERRMINFTVTISSGGRILAEATRPTQWMGVDEWLNYRDCWPFISAFVQPESNAVKKILDHAVEVLEMIGAAGDSFSGYQKLDKDPDVVRRQVKAIYLTLQKKFSLDYIAPPPPVIAAGSGHTVGQQIRFPEEVIRHKRGTCHDLALLFAACAEHARINSMVVLISGHTFFGFWKSEEEHTKFWKLPQLRDEWTIISSAGGGFPIKFLKYKYEGEEVSAPKLLQRLQEQGKVDFVECTCVTGSKTFEKACGIAVNTIKDLKKSQLRVVVDVRRSRGSIRPIRSRPAGPPAMA